MTRPILQRLLGASAAAVFAASVLQAAPTNPYQVITDANAFRLRPPIPRQIEPPSLPPKLQVTVKLMGVINMFGHERPQAFLEIQEAGRPAVIRAVLRPGEQSNGVEILRIDVGQGTATVRLQGVETRLHLAGPEFTPSKLLVTAAQGLNPHH